MKWWHLPLVLVVTQMAYGFELVNYEGRLIFSNPSCNNAREVLRALVQWNITERSQRQCDIRQVRSESGCSMDITKCVPESLAETLGRAPMTRGPNCWNSALVFRKILPALRYSDLTEMKLYLESPLCQQVSNFEPRQPGDVGAIRVVANNQTIEVHGFILISDNLVYSKSGFARSASYGLQRLDEVLYEYNVPNIKKCRQNSINFSDSECLYQTSYHRCLSMLEYLQRTPGISPILLQALTQLNIFERHLESRVLYGRSLPDPAKLNVVEVARVVAEFAGKRDLTVSPSENIGYPDGFILRVIQKRLDGIVQQLDATNDGDLGVEISTFESELWDLLEAKNLGS